MLAHKEPNPSYHMKKMFATLLLLVGPWGAAGMITSNSITSKSFFSCLPLGEDNGYTVLIAPKAQICIEVSHTGTRSVTNGPLPATTAKRFDTTSHPNGRHGDGFDSRKQHHHKFNTTEDLLAKLGKMFGTKKSNPSSGGGQSSAMIPDDPTSVDRTNSIKMSIQSLTCGNWYGTTALQTACTGKPVCSYTFNTAQAPGCTTSATVEYSCKQNGSTMEGMGGRISVPVSGAQATIALSCDPTPVCADATPTNTVSINSFIKGTLHPSWNGGTAHFWFLAGCKFSS
eukprot:TRINITY_DN61184_c0_g1_i1.p1 TRINITY_DN61184_c0_g1~~TRINITY_DN61184_c0_g1_i1.p1  ORF type:complete len:285 (-),score=27.18 TRINITY_DN61184_c0_g1_i1:283-1137(-)